ncbi:MAG: ribonuclease P protein component [Verrucomicrobiaceae bacterium]
MRLTRQRRMRDWSEFQSVREGGHSAAGRYLVIGALKLETLDDHKFGLITSKKASRKAVIRNLLRRRFREIIRKWGHHLAPGHMVVTIARYRAADATFQDLERDWIKTAKRLNLWIDEP